MEASLDKWASTSPMESRILRLEGEIEEDVVGELESFVRHSKFGIYTTARAIFAEALVPHRSWFPVAAEFAEMLLEQGDFRALESFATEMSEPSHTPFYRAELELFRLFRAMARIHTAGLLKEALQETGIVKLQVEEGRKAKEVENAMVYVDQITDQGPDDAQVRDCHNICLTLYLNPGLQIQIQILRLKIMDLGYRTSSFVSGLDFRIPWKGASLESPWKSYYTWYKDLVSQDRQWEAQFILGLYGDRGAQSVEHITACLDVHRPKAKDDERSIVACYGLASVLFASLTKLVWNGRNLDETGWKNAENYLAVMEACVEALKSSAQGTRLHQMVTLSRLDLLAMSVASKALAMDANMDAELKSAREGLLQTLIRAETTNDYVMQLETMWRLPLVFKYEEMLPSLETTLEKWGHSGDTANYLKLVQFLDMISWLTMRVDLRPGLLVDETFNLREGYQHFMVPEINRIAHRLGGGLSKPKIEDLPHSGGDSRQYAAQLFLKSLQEGVEGIALPVKPTQRRVCPLIVEYMQQHKDANVKVWSKS